MTSGDATRLVSVVLPAHRRAVSLSRHHECAARCQAVFRVKDLSIVHPVLLPVSSPPNARPPFACTMAVVRTVSMALAVAFLPLVAEAQVLDTLTTESDSIDYEVETYFVKVDTASFFKPHNDKKAVRTLLTRTGRGRCRVVTVVRAVNQRRADTLARRYDGGVVNMRLIVRCAPSPPPRSSMPTLSLNRRLIVEPRAGRTNDRPI